MDSFDSSSNVILASGGFGIDITFPKTSSPIENMQDIILASGGFNLDLTLPSIEFLDDSLATISDFDTTNTIRISFDVRLFNEKIGLYKNSTNDEIITTDFDSDENRFLLNTISFDFDEFKQNIAPYQILSLGSFKNNYSDFTYQVNKYFHFPANFELFSRNSTDNLNMNVFNSDEFVRTLNDTIADASGNIINAFSGHFIIYGINRILTKIVETNTFLNRSSGNYTIGDGFIAGDKILIIPGMTFDMGVVINNPYSLNIDELSLLTAHSSSFGVQDNKLFQKQYRAPMLLELNNLS